MPEQETMESKVEEGNNDNDKDLDLQPRDDGHDAGDTAAATRRPSRWESGGGDPASQGTSWALKSKQSSPPLSGPVQETLKGSSQLPARAQAKADEPAGRRTESPINDLKAKDPSSPQLLGQELYPLSDPLRPEEEGRISKSVNLAQIQPTVPIGKGTLVLDWWVPPPDKTETT
ncbi:uncharacterized protein ARMOST_06948 [Armillaria ostoyae]|uniref:Uncharacterized protein n=1 Tax=Armillaria ostoyae TaxID=47428 RepID=A0A284R4E0_ARMOS|nr:uncharacterized protein ARMOST_06948 [Armillaria ostoyae]